MAESKGAVLRIAPASTGVTQPASTSPDISARRAGGHIVAPYACETSVSRPDISPVPKIAKT